MYEVTLLSMKQQGMTTLSAITTKYHVSINAKTHAGESAVGMAKRRNHPAVVALLQGNCGFDDGLPDDFVY